LTDNGTRINLMSVRGQSVVVHHDCEEAWAARPGLFRWCPVLQIEVESQSDVVIHHDMQ